LCGHSLGGISTTLYAQKYPELVKALAPISTVVSGKLSIEAHKKEDIDNWRDTGWRTTIGYSSGIEKNTQMVSHGRSIKI
jgi:pimeloyl-ACP methyl ester carboxylesterase